MTLKILFSPSLLGEGARVFGAGYLNEGGRGATMTATTETLQRRREKKVGGG